MDKSPGNLYAEQCSGHYPEWSPNLLQHGKANLYSIDQMSSAHQNQHSQLRRWHPFTHSYSAPFNYQQATTPKSTNAEKGCSISEFHTEVGTGGEQLLDHINTFQVHKSGQVFRFYAIRFIPPGQKSLTSWDFNPRDRSLSQRS